MIQAYLKRFPWRSRLVAVLLLIVIWSVTLALAEVAQGLDRFLMLTIVALAMVIGWGLAALRISGRAALAVSLLTGAAILTVRIGLLGDELVALPLAFVRFAGESVGAGDWASTAAIVGAAEELVKATVVLYSRLGQWIWALATAELIVDPVASAMTWSALIWGAVVWAAWAIRRPRQPIAAVLPLLSLLGITFVISAGRPSAFVVPLGSTLLLMAFAVHNVRQGEWEAREMDTPEGTTSSIAVSAVPIALGLTLAAAWAQSFSLQNIVQVLAGPALQNESSLVDSLGLARQSRPETGLESVLVPGLPNKHLIGSGPELSERPVMEVTLADFPMEEPTPGYRWRAVTYDRYNGRGWQTNSLVLQDFEPGEPFATLGSTSDRVVHQFVRVIGDVGGLGYSAGSPAVLDHGVQVAWRASGVDAFALTIRESLYQVESIIPEVSLEQLRGSGSGYPDWVSAAYLDLPEGVPDRVLALGRDLTATAATPYDRAQALEDYLRVIPYTLDVPVPPSDRDIVDYFLFDLKKGYCDYYASSMVVLARAAGLPARLVVGYFTGTPLRTEGTIRYLVTEADAHSWVEVYFQDIGWVEFDPTGGRPAIERPDEERALVPSELGSLELELERERPFPEVRLGSVLGGAVLSFAIGWFAWAVVISPLRLRNQAPAGALHVLYRRLRNHSKGLGIATESSDTPQEFQAALAERLSSELAPAAHLLVEAHERAAYSREPPTKEETSQQIHVWGRLSTRLWLARIGYAIRRVARTVARGRNLKSPGEH